MYYNCQALWGLFISRLTNNLLRAMLLSMELKEELKAISGRKRRFLLLRIIDVGAEAARQLCGVTRGTYNSWLQNDAFVELYRRRVELSVLYKEEALRLIRRDNQLQAVLLEEKIINKMREEIESGNYELIRTNLAREVYSKIIGDLDYQPASLSLTWEQKIQQLRESQEPRQIEGGAVVDGEVVSETDSQQEAEHPQGELPPESKPTCSEVKEKAEKA